MKKKTVSLGILLLIVSLFGCSTDSDGTSESFIKAKIGGVSWESSTIRYSNLLAGTIGGENGQSYDLSAQDENFRVELFAAEIGVSDGCMTNKEYTADFNYLTFLYAVDGGTYVGVYAITPFDDSEESDVIVNVTSCGDGKISGTFSGTLYLVGDGLIGFDTPDIISITEGEFKNVLFDLHNF